MELNSRSLQDGQIDLIELIKVFWAKKSFIAKVTGIFAIIGLIIAFTSPKEYKTSSILIAEIASEDGKLGGQLGGLASLAGVDLGGLSSGNQGINPALYQSISRSTPFFMELMEQKYYFQEVGDTISIYDYYIQHHKSSLINKVFGLPGIIMSYIKRVFISQKIQKIHNDNDAFILALDEHQTRIIADLTERIYVEMDWELRVLTVQAEMQDPVVAAKTALFTQQYITQHVIDYATSKSIQQLASIERQYQIRKEEFQQVQYELANLQDRNQNVVTSRAKSEEERLQSEYNLAFNIFNQIAQQRESVKMQIQKDTPIFTVLEPVKIPIEKSKPNTKLTMVVFLFTGIIFAVSYLLIIIFLEKRSKSEV